MNFNIQSLHNWYRGLLQNPKYRWWVVAASIAYLLSPIDLIPDFLPFAGLVDDTLIISLLVSEVAQVAKTKLQSKTNRSTPNTPDASGQVVDVRAIAIES
ncbi:MAG: DUF1232 domain-containing protein [Chamaesiphon sp. CSU_1_12]|nr:DUF1232 domain-containing protein [Chamaesiphon sp. CSU_1_12]